MTVVKAIYVNGTKLLALSTFTKPTRDDYLAETYSKGRMAIALLQHVTVLLPNKEYREVDRETQLIKLEDHSINEYLRHGYCIIWGHHPQKDAGDPLDRLSDADTGAPLELYEDYTIRLADIYIEPEPTLSLTSAFTPATSAKPKLRPLKSLAIPYGHKSTLRLTLVKMVHDELIKQHPEGDWTTDVISVESSEGKRFGIVHEKRGELIDSIVEVENYRGNDGLSPENFKDKKYSQVQKMLQNHKCSAPLSEGQAREVLDAVLSPSKSCEHICNLLNSKLGRHNINGQHNAVVDLLKVIKSEKINFNTTGSGQVEKGIKEIVDSHDRRLSGKYFKALSYVLTNNTNLG